jgi:hypothetical protein
MRLISFDVGIKNLSFCILIIESNQNIFNIELWDTINLCEEIHYCNIKDNNSDCLNLAKYFKNNIYYCKKHTKNNIYEMPPTELNEKIIKKLKLNDLIELSKKYNIFSEHEKYTKNMLLEKFKLLLNEKYFNIIKSFKTEEFNLIELGINMRDKLNNIFTSLYNYDENNIDLVLIENQISPLASRMKCLQGMIAQYFIMRNINNIIFYSASNKLKLFLHNEKTTYKERKLLSINYTTNILSQYKELTKWILFFSKHSKKDDLSDSFLQGLSYFIKYNNLLINLNCGILKN